MINKLIKDIENKYSNVSITIIEKENNYVLKLYFFKCNLNVDVFIKKDNLKDNLNECLRNIMYSISYELQKPRPIF